MALRAADPIGSDPEPFSFELGSFELDGDRCLELRGRWFGVRGRRFVRPTLVMRIDGERHRLLADLDHKPWAAEEGEEWVASFSPAPPAGRVDEIELSVAPDITISLATPGSRALAPTVKRRATRAKAAARPAAQRKGEPSRGQRALEAERAKARDLGRQLEEAGADNARLAAERDALTAERENVQGEQALLLERVAELEGQLRRTKTRARAALSKAKERIEAERAETNRLRALLDEREAIVADSDRLASELDTVLAERETVLAEREAALAERDQLAAQASEPGAVALDPRPVSRVAPARRVRRTDAARRAEHVWAVRALVIIALCAVLLALALVLHFV